MATQQSSSSSPEGVEITRRQRRSVVPGMNSFWWQDPWYEMFKRRGEESVVDLTVGIFPRLLTKTKRHFLNPLPTKRNMLEDCATESSDWVSNLGDVHWIVFRHQRLAQLSVTDDFPEFKDSATQRKHWKSWRIHLCDARSARDISALQRWSR